jgi:hypothetical protein
MIICSRLYDAKSGLNNSIFSVRKTFRFILISLAVLFVLEIVHGTMDIFLLRPWPSKSTSLKFPIARGAIHVHSKYSDGSGSVSEIMEAARRCSLDFVVLSDHNNVRAGLDSVEKFWGRTLLIVGEEISTNAGHVLSIGARQSHYAPALSDIPRLVQEIHSDSGLAFIAHPDHPRMRWKRDDLGGAGGMEIINADAEWRNDSPREIFDAFLAEIVGLPGMNYLLDAPVENMRRWDEELRRRPVVGIGSVDAHARIKLGGERYIGFPSYGRMFGLLNTFLILNEPFASDPLRARGQILDALRRGRVFLALQSLGDATGFEFYGERDGMMTLPQDTLFFEPDSTCILHVIVPSSEKLAVQLYRNGSAAEMAHSPESRFEISEAGLYRVVVFQERIQFPWLSRRRVPWIFSNTIFVARK